MYLGLFTSAQADVAKYFTYDQDTEEAESAPCKFSIAFQFKISWI